MPGQPFGEVLDVDLVDHRLGEGPVRRDVALPVERLVDHHTSGHVGLGVAVVPQPGVAGQLDPDLVAEERRCQPDVALDRPGVGVEQELGLVVAQTVLRLPRTGGPDRVPLPGVTPRRCPNQNPCARSVRGMRRSEAPSRSPASNRQTCTVSA